MVHTVHYSLLNIFRLGLKQYSCQSINIFIITHVIFFDIAKSGSVLVNYPTSIPQRIKFILENIDRIHIIFEKFNKTHNVNQNKMLES